MKTAIVLGASGLVGKFVLSYLLMNNEYEKVIVVVRKELPLKDPKLEQLVIDFNQLEQYADRIKADDIFCCLGTTIAVAGSKEKFRMVDYEYPLKFAEFGLRNGTQKFLVVTALGSDKNSSIFYSRVKGELEEALIKLNFPSLHIFQPSMLTGLRKEFRLGEKVGQVIMKVFSFAMIGGLKKYKSIDAMVVAYAMVKKAQEHTSGVLVHVSDAIQAVFDNRNK